MTENVEQNLIYVSVYSFSLTIEILKKKKKKATCEKLSSKVWGS